eukprot:Skav236102  [mRNA]  locus=scaffold1166:254884:263708:+ [translate_table: standard]
MGFSRLLQLLVDQAEKNGTGSQGKDEAADGVGTVSLYNPENRRIFLVAAPITLAMAAYFECSAKYRMAETDLSAPLPQARGEDVVELQTLITKKVNWAEYNAVLKKLADLRQYVDGMAESVFIGQREALESEFATLLMLYWVEKALSDKAEFTDLNDVRARLERLLGALLWNGKMKEIADDQGKQVQQLAALERVMKKQERETRFSEESTHVSSFFNPSRLATADTTCGEWGAGLSADVRAMAATGGVRGMYGLSPRVPLPTSNRTMSKKAKRTF